MRGTKSIGGGAVPAWARSRPISILELPRGVRMTRHSGTVGDFADHDGLFQWRSGPGGIENPSSRRPAPTVFARQAPSNPIRVGRLGCTTDDCNHSKSSRGIRLRMQNAHPGIHRRWGMSASSGPEAFGVINNISAHILNYMGKGAETKHTRTGCPEKRQLRVEV